MSVVNSSVSIDILERRHRRVEAPLTDLDVLTIYECQPVVVDWRSVLLAGVWHERSNSVDALETVRRHFLQSDRVRAFMPGLCIHSDVKALVADILAYRRSLVAEGSSINTSNCQIVCPS